MREEAGLLFVWPDPESADAAADAAAALPPPVPDVVRDDILAPRHRWYPRALPFDWSFHTENVIDAAHGEITTFPFSVPVPRPHAPKKRALTPNVIISLPHSTTQQISRIQELQE